MDDSANSVELASRHLGDSGFHVLTASSVAEAVDVIRNHEVDLVITDYRMPNASGLELVRYVHENFRHTAVMMVTGFASIDNAVTAVQSGADEYLSKPYTEQELLGAVARALERRRRSHVALMAAENAQVARYGMIGTSPAMQRVFHTIAKVANSNASALIFGESGVGKELVARAIHCGSSRRNAQLVPVNCGAIPQDLFESEIFGHARGAFTGATSDHPGFFQASDGGTLFLDEIGELTLNLQVKLLRVLQDREVYMVGSTRPRKVDVRILAATSKDLPAMVRAGSFREDLFYRLGVVRIDVPALRERGDDVLLLAAHFAAHFSVDVKRPPPQLSDDVLRVLSSYPWPGNARELENLMQQLVLMAEGPVIQVSDLPAHMRFSPVHRGSPERPLRDVEQGHIRSVLDSVGGNKTRAAQILGIDRKTLREKLKSLG